MLTIAKMAHPVTVALDACGDSVMLSLQDVDGVRFRQALDASDAGAVLGVCNGYVDWDAVCEGDLVVYRSGDGLTFRWPCDSAVGLVHLSAEDMFVFGEALKSYCRLFMRSPREDRP